MAGQQQQGRHRVEQWRHSRAKAEELNRRVRAKIGLRAVGGTRPLWGVGEHNAPDDALPEGKGGDQGVVRGPSKEEEVGLHGGGGGGSLETLLQRMGRSTRIAFRTEAVAVNMLHKLYFQAQFRAWMEALRAMRGDSTYDSCSDDEQLMPTY